LRERRQDIPLLVDHFLDLAGATPRPAVRGLERLLAHDWPGNVRELRNVVDRALALSRGRPVIDLAAFLGADDAPAAPASTAAPADTSVSFKEAKGRVVADFESRYLEALLREHDHNISVAAREAGIDRKHFKDLMRRYGLAVPRGEPEAD
jgi:DNA-binding NtrC family response regulator